MEPDMSDLTLFADDRIAWENDSPDHEQWEDDGRRIALLDVVTPWAAGDWIAYGEKQFRGALDEAAKFFRHRDTTTLARWAHTAELFPPERRRAELHFSHHAECNPLSQHPHIVDQILDKAVAEGLPTVAVRELVQHARRELAGRMKDLDVRSTAAELRERKERAYGWFHSDVMARLDDDIDDDTMVDIRVPAGDLRLIAGKIPKPKDEAD